MHRKANVILLLLAIAGLGVAAYVARPRASARASFDHYEHDFGQTKPGELLKHTFTLTNTGSAPLLIGRLGSTCDCSKVAATQSELAPGEVAAIEVALRVRDVGFSTGVSAFVYTNDPASPISVLKLAARTAPEFTMVPSSVDFGIVPYRSGRDIEFKVFTRLPAAPGVAVEDVVSPCPVRASWDSGNADWMMLRLSLSGTAAIGSLTGRLVISLPADPTGRDGEQGKVLTHEIRGRIRGPVRAEPSEVIVSADLAEPVTRVAITATNEASRVDARVLEITEGIRRLISARVILENGRTVLEIRPAAGAGDSKPERSERRRGAIRLAVSAGEECPLHIPVLWLPPQAEAGTPTRETAGVMHSAGE